MEELELFAPDELRVALAEAGTPGIDADDAAEADDPAEGEEVALAAVLGLGAVFVCPRTADGFAAALDGAELTGTPGMDAPAPEAADVAAEAAEAAVAVLAFGELAAVVVAVTAAVPGMAAIASSACWSSCGVAVGAPADGCFALAADPDVADPDVADEDFGAETGLVAAVVTAGRSPLSTKPSTPFELSEPEYSCALTEKFGRESPPMVDSTPPEYPVTTSTCWSNSTQSPGSGW